MLTYGKRKKSILPSFSSLRDSSATSRSKAGTSKKRASTALDSGHGLLISNPISSHHNNNIDEMASMLLDTTTISDPNKHMAITHLGSPTQKDLPQLPQLLFNGDDAWAQKTTPVVTAAGKVNEMQFIGSSERPENSTSQFFGTSVEQSTPPIPRRSSKRKSVLPKNAISNTKPAADGQEDSAKSHQVSTVSITPPMARNEDSMSTTQAAMINAKIQAMLAASNALKPNASGNLLQGPFVPTKKRRIKDNKVIVKVRTAINDRLNSRSIRKRHDPVRDDRLLDNSLNDLHEEEGLSQCVSAIDIRLNEGDNFNRVKVAQLTGHGNVPRKPVADDGRSIRSRKSNSTDPFSERPGSSGIIRTPTNFELSLKDDMSIDPSAEILPDLPTSRPQSSRESLPRGKKLKGSPLAYDTSFDALFSSSPLAQSTPRIRLEPTLAEDGRRTLRNVPTDSRSLFDPDTSSLSRSEMDIDATPGRNQTDGLWGDRVKRKSSEFKDGGLFKYHSKRKKKHPSPSKAELEGLEKAMNEYPACGASETLMLSEPSKAHEAIPSDVGSLFPAPQLLAPKDLNQKVKEQAKAIEKRMGLRLFPKPELSRSGVSMPDIGRRPNGQKSMIPRPADTTNGKPRPEARDHRYSLRDDVVNGTAMDIDELQWDKSAYQINMKKKT